MSNIGMIVDEESKKQGDWGIIFKTLMIREKSTLRVYQRETLDDYGSKVDALVDSMVWQMKKVHYNRRRDLDSAIIVV